MASSSVLRQGSTAASSRYVLPSRVPAARLCWPRLSSISSMNKSGSSGDVLPLGMPSVPRRWSPADTAENGPQPLRLHSTAQQQQQQQQACPYAPTTMAISADASAPTSFDYKRSAYSHLPVVTAAEAAQELDGAGSPASTAAVAAAPAGALVHVHVPFAVLMAYLAAMAAFATNSDWYMDCAWFAGMWAGLWAACCRLHPSPRTAVLLNLVPVMHMSGALGTYHWELGNLSWDILTHITNGFIGTLLFASCLADLNAANQQQHSGEAVAAGSVTSAAGASAITDGMQHGSWRSKAWGMLQLSLLLLAGTSLIEVVEAWGGVLAGEGEGIFLRGAGDFCTASFTCSEEVDTMKDMVDNIAGMMLALLALATGSKGSSSSSMP